MIGIEPILHLLVYLAALFGTLPVIRFLDSWVILGLVLATLLGVVGDRRGHYLLKKTPATLLSFGLFGLFLLQVSRANLVEPLIHMLCLLLAVRLATEKSPRNILQLFLLATIILAASSMLTLDMAYLAYLVLLILLVTFGLVLLTFYASDRQLRLGRRDWRLLLKVMTLLPVGSLLLMLVLFVVLPRTQMPLWNFLNPKPTAVIGMSDEVRPGTVLELSTSGRIAFRVEVEKLPVDSLYWRGIVLNQLEGQVWKRSAQVPKETLVAEPSSEILLNFFTEPKSDRYLVTLDQPRSVEQIRHRQGLDGVVTGRWGSGRKLRYQVRAQPAAYSRLEDSSELYLQLPEKLSARVRDVGRQVASAGETNRQRIDQLERFFLQQNLSYSARRLPATENPVETFLFETRRGYCEYFASSFALLLRLAGVPARLVGGYLGGDYNDLGGYYLVGEDLAHVWVEALDDEGRWLRIDPSRLATNAEQALLASRQQGLPRLRVLGDALLHNWSRLVLNYDLRQQFSLIREVGQQVRGIGELKTVDLRLLLWMLSALALIAGRLLWQRHRKRDQLLIRAYRKQVARSAGLEDLPVDLGLFALAKQSGEELCRRFAEVYGRSIYRGEALSQADYQQLRQIIRQLRGRRFSLAVEKLSRVGDNSNSPDG